jgi:CrcB protein
MPSDADIDRMLRYHGEHVGMMSYAWVALGSALGGMARYACSGLAILASETFPWATLFVNVAGSLAIGVLFALVAPDGRLLFVPDGRALLMIGVCGGFTTFSSFSLETLNLARNGAWVTAGSYVIASVVLCLVAVWVGYLLTSSFAR